MIIEPPAEDLRKPAIAPTITHFVEASIYGYRKDPPKKEIRRLSSSTLDSDLGGRYVPKSSTRIRGVGALYNVSNRGCTYITTREIYIQTDRQTDRQTDSTLSYFP